MRTGTRDGLLDEWVTQNRRLSLYEASQALAVDLLMECVDIIDPHQHPRLHTAIRSYLLNVQVGSR